MDERLDELLAKTSRTFALCIPELPPPLRREVTVAYLLFRVADTFEDASRSPRELRAGALRDLQSLLADPDPARARELSVQWSERLELSHSGYRELLEETPRVLAALTALAPSARRALVEHRYRTADGMAAIVNRTGSDGTLRLRDVEDLREYCYIVAGIVGEMLTELFLRDRPPLAPVSEALRERAPAFGEGLQLVNVLKDSETDAVEGRAFLPETVSRDECFALARQGLRAATEYTGILQEAGVESGLVAFNALPVRMAWATLDRVEESGPGSKISRTQVWEIVADVRAALEEGRPAVRVPAAHQPAT